MKHQSDDNIINIIMKSPKPNDMHTLAVSVYLARDRESI